jgi:hypothetical protein
MSAPRIGPWGAGAGKDKQLQTWLGKEQADEIQHALPGPGSSMNSAPVASDEPGIGPSRRLPAELVTRCPLRLLPPVKELRGAGTARGSGRPCSS